MPLRKKIQSQNILLLTPEKKTKKKYSKNLTHKIFGQLPPTLLRPLDPSLYKLYAPTICLNP